MARDHARVSTSIWADEDFRALSPEAQRMYLLILSQDGLSYCGAMTFTPRRWAALSIGTDGDQVEKAVHELELARFLIVDWELDELLVRTFVRNDGGLIDQPNMMIAVRKAADAMLSDHLKTALANDLIAHVDDLQDRKGWREISSWVDTWAKGSKNPSPNPFPKGSAKVDPPLTPPPAPAPAPSPATTTSSTGVDSDDPLEGFDAFWNRWPRRAGKRLHRDKAEAQWRRLSLDERRDAYRGAGHYAAACTAGSQGAMDAFRWLRDRSWPDWQEPATPVPRGSPPRGRPAHAASDAIDRNDPTKWG